MLELMLMDAVDEILLAKYCNTEKKEDFRTD